MTTIAIGNRRLLKLADHIESANRGLDIFKFSTVFGTAYKAGHPCGTSGCAMGELPVLFPRAFEYYDLDEKQALPLAAVKRNYSRTPITVRSTEGEASGLLPDVARWFGLRELEAYVLFIPMEQALGELPEAYRLRQLPERSKARTVAKQIRTFVKRRTEATH